MTTRRRACLHVLFLLLVAPLGGCLTEPASYGGLDDGEKTTSGTWATGSRYMAPANYENHPELNREPQPLHEKRWPPLPRESINSLRRFMSEEELLSLLGEPFYKDVQVTDIDSGENDWNATLYLWKFQDSLLEDVPLARDLEVRLGWVGREKTLPERPEITGPAWVVLDWELR